MSTQTSGMTWAPEGTAKPVVEPGEFVFAAAALDHGHVNGQTQGLIEAGATLKYVYDPDPKKVAGFVQKFPQAKPVDRLETILDDPEIKLVTSAAIPCDRGPLGMKVLDAGKDYFTDKSPFTTLEQLETAKQKVKETGKKYAVYYSERLHNHAGWYGGQMLQEGAIGKVLQVLIMAPHQLSKPNRPEWFFQKDKYGGILTDIGSHQFEQFLTYSSASDASVNFARVDNFANADTPGLEDFGEASLVADTGASCYCRVDWFTPPGLAVWGDGRVFVIGEKGYMEIRKYYNFGDSEPRVPVILLADEKEERKILIDPKSPFPFFGKLILDCLNGTETAMTQAHAFKAAELSMLAQKAADEASR